MKTFLILDGNSLLHRAWHAIPPLTTKDGRVVNAAYGFTMVIEKMREKYAPDYMAVAWDLPGGTFRHEEYAEYKGTRAKKEPELYEQIPLIQEILADYNVPSLSAPGFEADDIVGTIAETYGAKELKVLIVTGDLDALQLVTETVNVVIFVKGLSEVKQYDPAMVKERYELTPSQLIDLKTLMGDASDNIPGIAGVGKKTATDLLKQYGTIEKIYDAIEAGDVPEKFVKKFAGQEKTVEQMKRLVTIVRDVELKDFKKEDAQLREPNAEKLRTVFAELEFKTLLRKYEGEGSSEAPVKKKAKKQRASVDLDTLNKEKIAVHIEYGQTDLFGSGIKTIALFDGKKLFAVEHPDKKTQKQILQALNASSEIIFYDAKKFFHEVGEVSAQVFDTLIASYLLAPGDRAFDFEQIVFQHLQQSINEKTSAAESVEWNWELGRALKEKIETAKLEDVMYKIEMPLLPILFKMEREGIEVDREKMKELSQRFGEELDRLTKKIHTLAGNDFNINSPSQLAKILFEDLQLPTKKIKKTKSGFSTAASELEKLHGTHQIIPLISEYRELAKLKSTYVDVLPNLIAQDGRIHTTYNQTIAATGRLSSINQNLQNIPTRTELGNEIRKAFVAPKGRTLVAMDYSQFELRLAADFSGDKSFIKAFNEGADVHRRTAAEVLGLKEEDVTKEQRYAAKAINFGILYGMGPRNLAKSTGFSQSEAQVFLDTYFQVHPEIREYIDSMKKSAHEKEYVETLFGRKRYLPDINGNIQMLVAAAERMAVNMPIQGTQADLIKMAMIDIAKWQEASDLDVKMLLQVHDELIFEIADNDIEKAVPQLQRLMRDVHKFKVPLEVNVATGTNWGAMREQK